MTIPVSVAPTVISKLATLIEAQVATDADAANILVTIGEPGPDDPDVIIEIGSNVQRHLTPGAFVGGGGLYHLEENIDVDIHVSVAAAVDAATGDTDRLTLVDRLWTVVGYVETAVRTDPSLGGIVDEAEPSATTGSHPVWSENRAGMICEADITVHCTVLN